MNEREKEVLKCNQETLNEQYETLKRLDKSISELYDYFNNLELEDIIDDKAGEKDTLLSELNDLLFYVRIMWEAIEEHPFKTRWEENELHVYKNKNEVCRIVFNEDELPKVIRIVFKNGQQPQWATTLSNLKFLHEIKDENE